MPTFTFPSGATIELPDGIPPCERPDTVTYDCRRFIPVGLTAGGRPVLSSHSCAAYARAASVFTLHEEVAKERARAGRLERQGKTWQAGNLRKWVADREARNARLIAAMVADPVPCTCALPYVPAVQIAEETGALKADVLTAAVELAERAAHQGEENAQATVYRLGPNGEVELTPTAALTLRNHFSPSNPWRY